jgi:dTDP-4-dehydrorhamnose reductase
MLGHKLAQTFPERFETHVSFRSVDPQAPHLPGTAAVTAHFGVRADDIPSVDELLAAVHPDVVINCIGIVKQDAAAKDPIPSIAINSLFPHQVAAMCARSNARLIHISTDCVFSGRDGNYRESDTPDAEDLYGRSKLLGEVTEYDSLTIRTSIIGRELRSRYGLLEWFLAQNGKTVRGFTRAIFSGFTTRALARILGDIIERRPALHGLWHVASAPISKFDLLSLIKSVYDVNIAIEPDPTFVCDRSLNGDRFREATGFTPPSWPDMIRDMHDDSTPYAKDETLHAAPG